MTDRPLRADARRNRERVLAAARAVFAEAGPDVPLDAIAARAGVGPGTVYRHFATKEALFEAAAVARVEDVLAEVRRLAAEDEPGTAFDAVLRRLADEAVVKRDLPDVLAGSTPAVRAAAAPLHDEISALLRRAQAAGAVRADVGIVEVIALFKGLMAAVRDSPDPGLADRLLVVIRDGLRGRPTGGAPVP